MKKILTLLATLAIAGIIYAGEYPDMSIKELKAAIDAKTATVIDANGTDSWKKGHIPTAIDFQTHKDKLAKALPADKNALIVAYCASPT